MKRKQALVKFRLAAGDSLDATDKQNLDRRIRDELEKETHR